MKSGSRRLVARTGRDRQGTQRHDPAGDPSKVHAPSWSVPILPRWRWTVPIAYFEPAMEFTLRAIHPSDIGSVHELQRRVEDRDRIPIATPREEFEDWLHEPHFDLGRDSRLAEAGGEVVAWGRIRHQPSEVREQQAYLHGAVDPALRGEGLGSALLSWQIQRATEILRSGRSEEHTSELQSRLHLVCRLLLEKKKNNIPYTSRSSR